MNWISRIFYRRKLNEELSEEIRQHLDERVEALVNGGIARREAVERARREFGNVTLLEERSREIWRWSIVETFVSDLRYAFR